MAKNEKTVHQFSSHIRYRDGEHQRIKVQIASPDLVPSYYLLFPNLKKWLGGKIFTNNEEMESAVSG